jgi:lactate dehydrogenase-like 2-hydroxyacid dehydrogenase
MTPKPVLWITRKLSANTESRAARDYDVIFNPEDTPGSPEKIIEMSQRVDAILPCHSEVFSASIVARLDDRLKIIANHSVGVDHCDLPALKARGITVTNTPDVLSDATAEIAMLLLLGAARRAAESDKLVREGRWSSWSPSFKVGQVMARRGRGFEMEIHYHNRRRLDSELEQGAVYHKSIESLLEVSQFLSLHCPATPESTGMMNADAFARLPEGAILVNTARGALVDEDALLAALESGRLAAAGLDCFQTEPGGNPEFSKHENIFMLPHIGSATFETRDAMGFRALDNLDAFFAGETPGDKLV